MKTLRSGALVLGLIAGMLVTQAAWAGQLKDGIAAVERQDFGHGKDLLEDYARKFPSDPRPYFYLSKCYESWYQLDNVETALSTYRQLNERRNHVLQTLSGADPVATYRAMLKDDPTDISARLLLIASLLQSGAPMIAMAELQAIPAGAVPNDLQDVTHAMWGMVYMTQSNWAQARSEFKECWRLNINNPLPAVKLAEIDKDEKAQQQAQQASLFKDDGAQTKSFELTFKLGKDLLDEGNFDGAIEAFTQAVAAKPDSVDAKQLLLQAEHKGAELDYQHGIDFIKDQKFEAAYESFTAALKLDPTFAKAKIAADDAKAKADAMGRALDQQPAHAP